MLSGNYTLWANGWKNGKVGDTSTNTEETSMNMPTTNDHDLLISINVRLIELQAQFKNHLMHHFYVVVSLLGVTLSSIVSLIIALIKMK